VELVHVAVPGSRRTNEPPSFGVTGQIPVHLSETLDGGDRRRMVEHDRPEYRQTLTQDSLYLRSRRQIGPKFAVSATSPLAGNPRRPLLWPIRYSIRYFYSYIRYILYLRPPVWQTALAQRAPVPDGTSEECRHHRTLLVSPTSSRRRSPRPRTGRPRRSRRGRRVRSPSPPRRVRPRDSGPFAPRRR